MAGRIEEAPNTSDPSLQRSVSLPVRPSNRIDSKRASGSGVASSPNSQVETLYAHPSARIVSFMTTSRVLTRPSSNGSAVEDEAGTLAWTSALERRIAVGSMTIYRAPGSVAFLSCGVVVHPILPKSQCWCVDDDSSKFVLQIRRPQYWRIEVPMQSPEDRLMADGLRDVLSHILLFEKTACPFRRTFTVELPEGPATPLKKRPWRPVLIAKKDTEDAASPKTFSEAGSADEYFSTASNDNVRNGGFDSDSDATDDTNATPRSMFPHSSIRLFSDDDISSSTEVAGGGCSVIAPPQLTIDTSPSKALETGFPLGKSSSIKSVSSDYSSSVDSFHTVQSWHSPITPLPPSPTVSNSASPTTYPYPHDNISLPKRPIYARETSEMTVTPSSLRAWEMTRTSMEEFIPQRKEDPATPHPKTPTLVDDMEDNLEEEHFEIVTPPSDKPTIRHRPTTGSNSRRRTLSPLPPAANLFSPSRRRPRHLQTNRHLPTAIIQKTCEILLSPPSHLLHLMLDIASKIAAGEWRGMAFGFGEGGEKIVGQWDYEDGEYMGDGWGEDDYGNSLGGKQEPKTTKTTREGFGRSWEID